MRARSGPEDEPPFRIRRKAFHLLLGSVFILSMIYCHDLKWFFLIVLAGGTLLSLVQDRVSIPVITWFLDRYDKEDDAVAGQGPLTFFLGATMVWFLFPHWIAIAAVITLTFGDPMAYTMGKYFGGMNLPWNRKKTLTGLITFTIVPFILILLIMDPVPALIISIAGGLIESVKWPLGAIGDDNIAVPILSALVLFLFSLVIHFN